VSAPPQSKADQFQLGGGGGAHGGGTVVERARGPALGRTPRGGWGPEGRSQRHVDVFEDDARRDVTDPAGRLDEVIAGPAGVITAERVGKSQRFGKLTSAHQKAGAIDSPMTFIHDAIPFGGGGPTRIVI
jgi:hypothetical protein